MSNEDRATMRVLLAEAPVAPQKLPVRDRVDVPAPCETPVRHPSTMMRP